MFVLRFSTLFTLLFYIVGNRTSFNAVHRSKSSNEQHSISNSKIQNSNFFKFSKQKLSLHSWPLKRNYFLTFETILMCKRLSRSAIKIITFVMLYLMRKIRFFQLVCLDEMNEQNDATCMVFNSYIWYNTLIALCFTKAFAL